jgi:glycosyltransferase involved in cell wall biosynthesis
MRILYFSRDYTTHDHRFLSALARTEHKTFYLRLERRGHQLDDRPLPPEIEIVPWIVGVNPVEFKDGPRLLTHLRKLIRSLKPDLIQAGPLQRSAFLAALTGFQPLVSMSWGYDLLVDAARNRWWRWATQYTLKRSAAFVGDSDIIREKAIEHGMEAEHIVTFPWGADIRRFSPGGDGGLRERLGWGEDAFVLLSNRGWSPIYGVEELARAFVDAARGNPGLRLLMLGNGPQAGLIRQIFLRGGVLEYVHFPGYVNQQELPNYYRAADLYISTSHSDGTSISLLEALGCGCPVLLSDIPGNREWVEPDVQGWWYAVGDVGALTKAILRSVESRPRLVEMGRAARALAESRGDWEKNFPRLFQAYSIATNSP